MTNRVVLNGRHRAIAALVSDVHSAVVEDWPYDGPWDNMKVFGPDRDAIAATLISRHLCELRTPLPRADPPRVILRITDMSTHEFAALDPASRVCREPQRPLQMATWRPPRPVMLAVVLSVHGRRHFTRVRTEVDFVDADLAALATRHGLYYKDPTASVLHVHRESPAPPTRWLVPQCSAI
jgi:hypothetical protein